MSDVARVAGVSHQTVSRVLNDHPNVRPQTRERVLAAIAELGYRRNSAARALVTRRSATIGIVTSGSLHFGPATTLAVLEQSARGAGYFVSVATATDPTAEAMTAIFGSFMDQSVEGIVVIAPDERFAGAARAASAHVPVLLLAAMGAAEGDPPILSVDQAGGARLLARHLLELGHRDLVHITGPPEWFDAISRRAAWHDELAAAGVRARPDIPGDWTAATGYAAARALVGDLPEAVFAANDQTALGVLHAFADAGVRVPQEVSVVGYDDVEGADHFIPPLTTVRQDFSALGREAMDVLIRAMRGEAVAPARVAPELRVRASTGPARTVAG
ncbi:LacI family DNA-binding transcriptional regulator [Ruania suaedae]|uniref:LacI family DNA-binding transcriptional regulator n=1 Tax=Ruania suaedae TaxID=2897774 RepID=UPI001E486031|nr:LacI family DNA-binding transcriptional regulator [Ruania suaedae]UFU02576.1 LacI family DNA-binding transcriptional regulator [Ruania suaedae]